MGIGVSLLLVAIGAVLVFAVGVSAIGWILLIVGAIGILLSMVFWSSWGGWGGRRGTIVEERRY
jgi:hypothetical protein